MLNINESRISKMGVIIHMITQFNKLTKIEQHKFQSLILKEKTTLKNQICMHSKLTCFQMLLSHESDTELLNWYWFLQLTLKHNITTLKQDENVTLKVQNIYTKKKEQKYIHKLPQVVIECILQNLTIKDVINFGIVNRECYFTSQHESCLRKVHKEQHLRIPCTVMKNIMTWNTPYTFGIAHCYNKELHVFISRKKLNKVNIHINKKFKAFRSAFLKTLLSSNLQKIKIIRYNNFNDDFIHFIQILFDSELAKQWRITNSYLIPERNNCVILEINEISYL